MDTIMNYLPYILPIMVLELALKAIALVSLYRRRKVRFNNKLIWALIIIFINLLGSILYFVAAGDDE